MHLTIDRLESPIGTLLLVCNDEGRLYALEFEDHEPRMMRLLKRYHGEVTLVPGKVPTALRGALARYFAGDTTPIDGIAVAASGGTAFQRTVWAALRRIPAGTTLSYGALAATIGHPTAMRAVGAANGANCLAIVVPCHRVIGANGTLTGYASGLPRKRWLLAHEGLAPTL
jgi:methylated-DNA-[protein]-cysteine S-methyltransferase